MYILDEDFNDPSVKHKHYLQHVARDWKDFENSFIPDEKGYVDPKFPPTMTESEYEAAANELAQLRAGTSNSNSPIIGFRIRDKKSGRIRNEKIRRTSKFVNNNKFNPYQYKHTRMVNKKGNISVMDVVIYKIENGKVLVISFMLSLPNKIYREVKYKVSELPENTKKGL